MRGLEADAKTIPTIEVVKTITITTIRVVVRVVVWTPVVIRGGIRNAWSDDNARIAEVVAVTVSLSALCLLCSAIIAVLTPEYLCLRKRAADGHTERYNQC